jgi:hypothetical protein
MSAQQLSPTTQPQAADMRAAGRRIVPITATTDWSPSSLVSMMNTHSAGLP